MDNEAEGLPELSVDNTDYEEKAPFKHAALKTGASCPCCGSANISSMDDEEQVLEHHIHFECNKRGCDARWWQIYTLTEVVVTRDSSGSDYDFEDAGTSKASLYTGGIEAEREAIQV